MKLVLPATTPAGVAIDATAAIACAWSTLCAAWPS